MSSLKLVYYKEDFDFLLTQKSCDGEIMRFPDFEVRFMTVSPGCAFTASRIGKKCLHCREEGDGIRFILNGHNLPPGTLRYEMHLFLPDPLYPDGTRDVYKKGTLNITLTKEEVGCPDKMEADVLAPYIKGEDGKSLTYDDLTPEQKADLMSHFDPESIGISSVEYSAEDIARITEEALAELESENESETEQPEEPGHDPEQDPEPKA